MNQFNYRYDPALQCLVKTTQDGKEVQRMFIPTCDLEKVCAIIWHQTTDKIFLEKE